MEQSKKKYLYLTSLLTSSSSQKLVIFILLGLVLIGFGVLAYKIDLFSSGDKVEVLTSTTEPSNNIQEIVVEIVGAVERAGVYKMHLGDRIDDLLITAGGISASADREWVDKYINRASKLIDGQKIYIYHSGEVSAKGSGAIKLDQGVLGVAGSDPASSVNINTASQLELEKLVGIGPVYATNIIEQRPYSNAQELVSKGAISQKVFEKIKNAITIY